jgi:chromosome segregation ATPase
MAGFCFLRILRFCAKIEESLNSLKKFFMEQEPKINPQEGENEGDNQKETPETIEAIIKEIIKNLEETEDELHKAQGEIAEAKGELQEILDGTQNYDDENKKSVRILELKTQINFLEKVIDRLEISKARAEQLLEKGKRMLEEKKKLH